VRVVRPLGLGRADSDAFLKQLAPSEELFVTLVRPGKASTKGTPVAIYAPQKRSNRRPGLRLQA